MSSDGVVGRRTDCHGRARDSTRREIQTQASRKSGADAVEADNNAAANIDRVVVSDGRSHRIDAWVISVDVAAGNIVYSDVNRSGR